MKRSTFSAIRTLRYDEPLPDSEPRRYRDGGGYVRLRWKVGVNEYVEQYEHRVVAGLPHPRYDVHHLNGDRTDNRPENLEVVERGEHASRHGAERPRKYGPYRSRQAQAKAGRATARRERFAARRARVRELYDEGMTTTAIAELLGVDSSTVSRDLRAAGGHGRTGPTPKHRRLVQARAQMRCETCAADLRWTPAHVHHRRPRKIGGTTRPDANQPANLLLVCARCHAAIESNRSVAYDAGWLVREPADPADVPVRLAVGVRYLTDDGRYAREGSG